MYRLLIYYSYYHYHYHFRFLFNEILSGDHSRLGWVAQRFPKEPREIAGARLFYRPETIPVTQSAVSEQQIEWKLQK